MKDGVLETIGKTISGVVVKKRDDMPRWQVFLLFSDETYFEFYGEDVQGISYVRPGGKQVVLEYMARGEVFLEGYKPL